MKVDMLKLIKPKKGKVEDKIDLLKLKSINKGKRFLKREGINPSK